VKAMNRIGQILLISLGSLFVVLGLIGLLLPVVPTTPFLMAAGLCFIKSSNRFYQKLIHTQYFGPHIQRYVENKEMSLKFKISSLVFMWIPTFITMIFIVDHWVIRLFSLAFAMTITIHILSLKTI
jgi:uncharacterized protein